MAVSENDLVVGPLTPASGVTTISLDFGGTGWEATWLEVYKSGSENPLVLNTDYTVAGAGTSSGVVTLTTPANGTDAYAIYLSVPLQRISDMQLRGEFKSEPFNIEMDRLWQSLQRHETLLGRSLRIGRTSAPVGALTDLTDAARAGRIMKFDATGAGLETGATLPDIEVVSGLAAEIATVAGISDDVTAVAGDEVDIGVVAANIANVNAVGDVSADVTTVAGVSAHVATVAGVSTDVATVAANVTDITNFADVYLGPAAADPTLRNDGGALQEGDLYFNTADDVMFVYDGATWLAAYASLSGALLGVNNLSDLTVPATALINLGLTATTAELNHVDGVTSAIQTQLDAKVPTTRTITAGTGMTGGGNLSADVTINGRAWNQSVWDEGTSNGEAIISPSKLKGAIDAQELQVGVGQTWQDVSRAHSTVYQNTTGKPIMVAITGGNNARNIQVSANGSTLWRTVGQTTGSGNNGTQFIVPDGWYYRVNGVTTFQAWVELR